jgi:hypothetical protein
VWVKFIPFAAIPYLLLRRMIDRDCTKRQGNGTIVSWEIKPFFVGSRIMMMSLWVVHGRIPRIPPHFHVYSRIAKHGGNRAFIITTDIES